MIDWASCHLVGQSLTAARPFADDGMFPVCHEVFEFFSEPEAEFEESFHVDANGIASITENKLSSTFIHRRASIQNWVRAARIHTFS